MRGNRPVRNPFSVWYIRADLYPAEFYPEFCSGSAYLVKSEDAAKIYSVCNNTRFFWIDDVFVTGMLRENYNLLMKNTGSESLDILTINDRYNLSCKAEMKIWCNSGMETNPLKYIFTIFDKNAIIRDMFCVWNKVRLMKFAMNNAFVTEKN